MSKRTIQKQPLVSIVILNWNRIQDTLTCLDSLQEQTYENYEIIVVDNGSIDDSKSILKNINTITFIDNPKNRGFTGGHIDGWTTTNGKYVFILNNDTVVDKEYLTTAVTILENNPKAAVVGGRSYHWKEDSKFLNTQNDFYSFQTINRNTMEGIFSRSDSDFDHEVNWVSGSAMLLRKSAIRKTGYFYDPMFAYYEESDLFARIQAHDYSIIYSPRLRIWHKDGASSSSLFQFRQLFKNRFIFALRHLKTKDILRFMKSYLHTTARGTLHHITNRHSTKEDRTLNRALFNSLLHSTTTWPRWIASRASIKKKDSQGYDLVDRLKIEQTGIAFVAHIANKKQIESFRHFIETTAYHHFNSEFILICDSSLFAEIERFRKSLACRKIIKIVTDRHQSKSNSLNLGWISASKQYVWFIRDNYQPNIKTIKKVCLTISDTPYAIYFESNNNTSNSVTLSSNICISRQLLALYGGLDDLDPIMSLSHIVLFSQSFSDAIIHREPSLTNKMSTITVTDEVKQKIKNIIQEYKNYGRRGSRYNRLLEKYYRLYQLNNLTTWLFLSDYSIRHKAGRLYQSFLAAITLDRQSLALELKHISNEIIKNRQSIISQEAYLKHIRRQITKNLKGDSWQKTPVFIICRDRLDPLLKLLDWLETIKLTNVILVDNDSLYPPLVRFLDKTSYQVLRTGKNVGHTVIWNEGIAKTLFPGEFYIVTDPDVIPDISCPSDVISHFYQIHRSYINHQKVGFGLRIDNLPSSYKLRDDVVKWEQQFWTNELEPGVFEAGIDTTFALYKPYSDFYSLHPSLRTGNPYVAQHMPWYVNSAKINEEEAFYRARASQDITSWNVDQILDRYKKEL